MMSQHPQSVTPAFGPRTTPYLSEMAEGLVGSEILKIASDVRAMLAAGQTVYNLTVGDFDTRSFPIPEALRTGITEALGAGETNYPPSDGMLSLRAAVRDFYRRRLGLDYPLESFIVTGGARPAIYATYQVLVSPGDTVVYPIPSWNNNHYCQLTGARAETVLCLAEDAFLPTRALLEGRLRGARLLSLCSPLNPTGTAFTPEALAGICDLVLEENARRGPTERPLFLMYDQVYWMLTLGQTAHVNPVSLRPEMAPYTIFVDGISKALAATGVRVGWCVAPPDVASSMSNVLGHVGAWAPRAEQVATAAFLNDDHAIDAYHAGMMREVEGRLGLLYEGFKSMREAGLPVDVIPPTGAIYLSVRFGGIGRQTPNGETLTTNEAIRRYLLEQAHAAVVPFQAFGATEQNGWFRLSVGAIGESEILAMLPKISSALAALT